MGQAGIEPGPLQQGCNLCTWGALPTELPSILVYFATIRENHLYTVICMILQHYTSQEVPHEVPRYINIAKKKIPPM